MAKLSPVLRSVQTGFAHWCVACEEMHVLPQSWQFDGNVEAPTFSPSFKHTWREGGADGGDRVCHYIITAGQIDYCGDCTRPARGAQPMAAIPDHEGLGLAGAE